MKIRIYNALVNRKPGIAYRYHKVHDESHGFGVFLSWIYLLWINFAYYVLHCRFLGVKPAADMYEHKSIPDFESESVLGMGDWSIKPDELTDKLKEYDVISFDVFDTLIFRPFAEPADLFYIVGEKAGIPDFKNLRIRAEKKARDLKYKEKKHYEVTLKEIWEYLEDMVGVPTDEGIKIEKETELSLCHANSFMLQVWNGLKEAGKRLVITTDMYLDSDAISAILDKNGFTGYEKIFVSCEYEKNKFGGKLQSVLKEYVEKENKNATLIHVGDNGISDAEMFEKAGIPAFHYPNTARYDKLYRAHEMSAIVGSAYRGTVAHRLYNGRKTYSQEYEYGYVYGGLFVLGYCNFIHELSLKEGFDKILFLSRDGDVLKQAYDVLFPEEKTEYVYWSRKAAAKLMADRNKWDYYRRFIYQKQGIRIGEALESMELKELAGKLPNELNVNDTLNQSNSTKLRKFLEENHGFITEKYKEQAECARKYYSDILKDCGKVAAVDIGWAGSGALSLSYLVEKEWNMPCRIEGVVAGTNTVFSAEPDASESFLQSGRLHAYLYSQSHNRDILKKHDPAKDHNVYWELLLASPTPKFEGFYREGLKFGEEDVDKEGAYKIRKGIMDFLKDYTKPFENYPYMMNISGRDAYAPMLAVMTDENRYLRAIESRFSLNPRID